MALILPKNYHKISAIERNHISWIQPELAERQDIRPLRIGILNVIIVFIISFVALIIIIETFKDQISIIIPNIKFVLNSLYETIRDIFLFSKDLIK